MSSVLRSITAADMEYINNSAVRSILVMTTDVAKIPPTIAHALYGLLLCHSCSLVMFFLENISRQDLQTENQKYALFLFVPHSPRGQFSQIMVVYPAERHREVFVDWSVSLR